MAFDAKGDLYVATVNYPSVYIVEISPTGQILNTISTGFYASSASIAIGPDGDLYVDNGAQIVKFSASGQDLGVFATAPAGIQFGGIAFAPSTVPEPSSLLMGFLSLGLTGGFVAMKQRRSLDRCPRAE